MDIFEVETSALFWGVASSCFRRHADAFQTTWQAMARAAERCWFCGKGFRASCVRRALHSAQRQSAREPESWSREPKECAGALHGHYPREKGSQERLISNVALPGCPQAPFFSAGWFQRRLCNVRGSWPRVKHFANFSRYHCQRLRWAAGLVPFGAPSHRVPGTADCRRMGQNHRLRTRFSPRAATRGWQTRGVKSYLVQHLPSQGTLHQGRPQGGALRRGSPRSDHQKAGIRYSEGLDEIADIGRRRPG